MNDSIFSPNYTITPTISQHLESIERNSWLIERMLLVPKPEAWLHREVRVGRVSATTRIEDATLDEAAVDRLLTKQGLPRAATEDEQANIDAYQAYEFIDFLSDQPDIPVDELVVRQLNRYFVAAAPSLLTPGAYRRGSNQVGDFRTPDQGDVPHLMRSFALWLRNDDNDVHPVIKASIAHLHLVAIHPFWDGNGRTARGLETLVLQKSRFGFGKLLSLESQLLNHKEDYFTSLRQTLGRTFSEDYDATPWLEFSTMVVKLCSDQLVAKTTDWHRMMRQARDSWAGTGWPQRYMDGLAYAIRAGRITRSSYMEITGVSSATASRDLGDMVAGGVLAAEGKTRTRVYYPARERQPVPEEQLTLPAD